jgi:hypothetical protein
MLILFRVFKSTRIKYIHIDKEAQYIYNNILKKKNEGKA